MTEVFTPNAAAERSNVQATIDYDTAVADRDAKALLTIATNNVGTPIADIAVQTAQNITAKKQDFDEKIGGIEKKGGANTPEGRKEIANVWRKTSDNPQWGTALIHVLMGDKTGALKQITGGDISERIVFDNEGNMLRKRVNAVGETLDVVDLKNNRLVMPQEYDQRKIGFSTLAETLAGKTQAIDYESRAKSLNENRTINNAWAAKFPELGQKYQEIESNLSQIQARKGEIPADLYAKLIKFTSQSQGQAASQNANNTVLNQWNQGAGVRAGEQISKSLTGQLGLEGVWSFNGKGGIVNDKGQTKSFSELQQAQNSNSIASENTKNFNQTKADILKEAQIGRLDQNLQKLLLRSLELSDTIGRDVLDLSSKVGTPSFISLPAAFSVENKLAQGRAQALQGMFSAEAMNEFQEYYKDSIKNYSPGQLPQQNELEANFVKTRRYKDLQSKYATQIKNVINEATPDKPAEAKSKEPVAPKTKIPEGYKRVGRTPDGKAVYRTPDGKQVTE